MLIRTTPLWAVADANATTLETNSVSFYTIPAIDLRSAQSRSFRMLNKKELVFWMPDTPGHIILNFRSAEVRL